MGEHSVSHNPDDKQARAFMRGLLEDVRALEQLLATELVERGTRRIGAEQEMFLVDEAFRPAPIGPEVLERIDDDRLTTELARFNLEANLSPRSFGGSCLRDMETELRELLGQAARAANSLDARVLLTGILPTLRKADLGLDNLTPVPRYFALNDTMSRLRGGAFHIVIRGIDELETTHDNVMLESCNTSFQIHFQVAPEEFAPLYNVAQLITAPVLAAAANSPVLLGRRLWSETRIALFQHSVDTRSDHLQDRGHLPRVHFGKDWVQESILEIFREDITRFRSIIAMPLTEDPIALVKAGKVPQLHALRLHSGTIYRWNRACYGLSGPDKAHLRIENRALPSGPTVEDEMANAALFFGLMASFADSNPRVKDELPFDAAKSNFFAAAQQGLRAQFEWLGGRTVDASALILEQLLPRAKEGLQGAGLDANDVTRYLDIIEARVRSGRTGARWAQDSLQAMDDHARSDLRFRTLTAAMWEHQQGDAPVHAWPLASLDDDTDRWKNSFETVEQIMSTDLFTVRPGDIVDLAASVMDWRHIRHVPVEDDEGRLVGLVSHRMLLRLVAQGSQDRDDPPLVEQLMRKDPITVAPETATLDAIELMRKHGVACLPVVRDERLVGIVTERDLIDVSAKLLEQYLRR